MPKINDLTYSEAIEKVMLKNGYFAPLKILYKENLYLKMRYSVSMLAVTIHIDDEIRRSIKNFYKKDDYTTVKNVVYDIFGRYFNTEHFDPKLSTKEKTFNYKICEFCGEKAKAHRMIDIDGTNLVGYKVCANCGSGIPALE